MTPEYANTLRTVLNRNATQQLMEGVLEADAEYKSFLDEAEALNSGTVTDTAEAQAIQDTARDIASTMETAVVVRNMISERRDVAKAARSMGLNAEDWAQNVTAYETGHADVQARIEAAVQGL